VRRSPAQRNRARKRSPGTPTAIVKSPGSVSPRSGVKKQESKNLLILDFGLRTAKAMAIRITKVYTRTGDKSFTKLVGGKKVAKDEAVIEAYKTINELNSVLDLARVFNDDLKDRQSAAQRLDAIFRRLQNELFDLGSELATPPDFAYEGMFKVGEDEVKALEK